jgi:deoxyribodipyrimidine photo-lyase
LGVHLRFGTISIRDLYRQAVQQSETFVKELAWREFFMHVLWHHPRVVDRAFKPAYDAIPWLNREEDIERWCQGQTGYPIVDAGMRELLATGFMHNRVRMVVAGFLVKHLLVDWRIGEAWFARHLLDFELASNNGNWQWAAGTGCDAAPYFRVFNPTTQAAKFDTKGTYIRRWVPEIESFSYPKPMVEHAAARLRAIETYQKALGK